MSTKIKKAWEFGLNAEFSHDGKTVTVSHDCEDDIYSLIEEEENLENFNSRNSYLNSIAEYVLIDTVNTYLALSPKQNQKRKNKNEI